MPVPLGHLSRSVRLGDDRIGFQDRGVGTQAHRSAQIRLTGDCPHLIGHGRDHRARGVGIELGRVGVGQTRRAGRLDHHALQPQTQAQHRDTPLAGVADGAELALDAPDAETAGDQHAVDIAERGLRTGLGLAVVRRHPLDVDLRAVPESSGAQRLGDRQIRVGQIDVLAHQGDSYGFAGLVDALQQIAPLGPIDVAEGQVQPAHHISVKFLAMQHLRDVIDGRGVRRGDDTVDVDVAHERDFVLERLGHLPVAAQNERVGGDTDAAQRGDRVLRGLGLELAGRLQVRHQGHMQEEDVVAADVVPDLARGLQERL